MNINDFNCINIKNNINPINIKNAIDFIVNSNYVNGTSIELNGGLI